MIRINYSKQFGFYKNISTSYAIISRNEIIYNCDDDKKMCNFHRSWESIRHCLSHPISTVNYLVAILEVLPTNDCM